MFGSFGWMELLLILIIVLIIFGAGKIPQLGEGSGKSNQGVQEVSSRSRCHRRDCINLGADSSCLPRPDPATQSAHGSAARSAGGGCATASATQGMKDARGAQDIRACSSAR